MMRILEEGEQFDKMWGYEKQTITIDEIMALLQGKTLYFTVEGEYACTLTLGKE